MLLNREGISCMIFLIRSRRESLGYFLHNCVEFGDNHGRLPARKYYVLSGNRRNRADIGLGVLVIADGITQIWTKITARTGCICRGNFQLFPVRLLSLDREHSA